MSTLTVGLLTGSAALVLVAKPIMLFRWRRKAAPQKAEEPTVLDILHTSAHRDLPARLRTLARHGRIRVKEISTRPKDLPYHDPEDRALARQLPSRDPGSSFRDNPAPGDTQTLHVMEPTTDVLRLGVLRNRWWHRLMDDIRDWLAARAARRADISHADEIQRWWAEGIRVVSTSPTYRQRMQYVGAHHRAIAE